MQNAAAGRSMAMQSPVSCPQRVSSRELSVCTAGYVFQHHAFMYSVQYLADPSGSRGLDQIVPLWTMSAACTKDASRC